jgi:small-conductance mechanosensitive channel
MMGERLMRMGKTLLDQLVAGVPKVLTALVLLIIAIVIARVIRSVLAGIIKRIKLDDLMVRAKLDGPLRRLGINSLGDLIPKVVYVLLLLVFAGEGAHALGLTAISAAISALFAYLPNVFAALVLLFLGSWAAQFISGAVARVSLDSGLDFGPALGKFVGAAVMFVAALTAAGQLGIETEMVRIVTICSLGALALAFGLSMGLGSRDITRNIMAGFYARKVFRAGDSVTIGETDGILKGITAMQTLIETPTGMTSVPNTVFLDGVVSSSRE